MKASLQSVAVLAIGVLMVFFSYREALADPSDYLAELQVLAGSDGFFAGRMARLSVKVTNRGRLAWPSLASDPSHPVRISYHWIGADGEVAIYDGLRTELPRDLEPGESLVVRVSVLSPTAPGTYTLVLDLVREGVTWFAERGSPPLKISPLKVQNTGGITWHQGRILLLAGGALGLLFLMGFGTARLFVPGSSSVLIPLVGVAVIIALSYYAGLLGMPMRNAKWGILTLGVVTTVSAIIARKRSSQPHRQGGIFSILLTAAMLILSLFPLWVFGRPSTVQNTYASYFVIMSEYWKAHSLREVPNLDPYQPLDYLVRERLLHRYVTGTPFLNAFIASTFNLNSYEIYSILTALLLALLPATLYWVARLAFRLGPWTSGLAAFLALFNVTYLLWSFRGQLPFVAGLLFLPLAVGAGGVLLEGRGSLLLAAFSLSTLFAVYPPLVPYALVPLLFYGVLQVLQKAVSLRALGLMVLKLFCLLILINPVILYNLAVSGASAARQVSENWRNIPGYPSIAELLGLFPHFFPEGIGSPLRLLTFGLVPTVFGIVSYGLYRAWKEGRWLLMATVIPYVLGALVIAFLMDYAYGYYKHGVVTLFAFLFAFVYGIVALWQRGRTWMRPFPVLCGGTFFLLSLLTLKATFDVARPRFVPPEMASLGAIKRLIKEGDVVFIDESDVSSQLWASYFLWGVPLSVPPAFEPWGWWGFSSVFGRGNPLRFYHPQTAYTLARWGEITRPRPEPIWSNALYLLHPGPPSLFLDRGWHELEEGMSTFRWMAGEGTLRLNGNRKGRPVRLRMILTPLVAPLTFEVLLGGERLGTFIAQDASRPVVFSTRPFSLDGKDHITIRSVQGCFEPARLFGTPDRRCLSAAFQEVALIENER